MTRGWLRQGEYLHRQKTKKRGKRGEVKLFDSRIAVIIEMLENASIGVSVDFAQTLHGCHCIV